MIINIKSSDKIRLLNPNNEDLAMLIHFCKLRNNIKNMYIYGSVADLTQLFKHFECIPLKKLVIFNTKFSLLSSQQLTQYIMSSKTLRDVRLQCEDKKSLSMFAFAIKINKNIRRVSLQCNMLYGLPYDILYTSLKHRGLERVTLSNIFIDKFGLVELNGSKITRLDVIFSNIDAREVASYIETNKYLREICIHECTTINDNGFVDFYKAILDNRFLKGLDLCIDNATSIDFMFIQMIIEQCKNLSKLEFWCSTDCHDDYGIVEALRNTTNIKQLGLGISILSDQHLQEIMKTQSSLEKLHIELLNVSDLGLKSVADKLQSDSLKSLRVTCNATSDAFSYLFQKLKFNTSLEELSIGSQQLDDIAIRTLADSLSSNIKLKKLKLNYIHISSNGYNWLYDSIQNNPNPIKVEIDDPKQQVRFNILLQNKTTK